MGGRRAIKSVLLGQRAVAGVGNIYADEALWMAGIRPGAKRLGAKRATALHAAIVAVLEEGLADGGTTLKDYRNIRGEGGTHQNRLHVYGQAGSDCKRCGSILRATRIDGRGTTWCPTCQH
jgi:formamidopyrimidine-DNA glycosylase